MDLSNKYAQGRQRLLGDIFIQIFKKYQIKFEYLSRVQLNAQQIKYKNEKNERVCIVYIICMHSDRMYDAVTHKRVGSIRFNT